MKIVVCIKQVPDTNEVKLDPVTNRLIRDGVPSIINHDDKAGIEAALQLRESLNDGSTVTVVSMGPPQADVALREALAMGCDEAYLLSAREFGGSDTCATAIIISSALKKIGYDLVITGRQAIDGDTAQVGPQIAENLNIPLLGIFGNEDRSPDAAQVDKTEEVLKKLEEKGLVTRRRSDLDERNLIVTITELGESMRDRALHIPGEMTKCINLPREDIRELYRMLHQLLEYVK